jgi:hypothetical protein
LLLFGLRAAAQSTCTVTRFDDTASVDQTTTDSNYNLPGLGAGVTGDLRYGLQQAIAAGGTWTINFASSCTVANPCTIVLSNPLPPIESGEDVVTESVTNGWQTAGQTVTTAPPPLTLTIDGGEFGEVVIDGNSGGTLAGASTTNRVFFVDSGTVTLANLQIQNALAQGGAGGGMGAGAGLFVNKSGAVVNVQNAYFLNCQAVGGSGGGRGAEAAEGGGGMGFAGGSGNVTGSGGGVLGAGNGSNPSNGSAGGGGGGGPHRNVAG